MYICDVIQRVIKVCSQNKANHVTLQHPECRHLPCPNSTTQHNTQQPLHNSHSLSIAHHQMSHNHLQNHTIQSPCSLPPTYYSNTQTHSIQLTRNIRIASRFFSSLLERRINVTLPSTLTGSPSNASSLSSPFNISIHEGISTTSFTGVIGAGGGTGSTGNTSASFSIFFISLFIRSKRFSPFFNNNDNLFIRSVTSLIIHQSIHHSLRWSTTPLYHLRLLTRSLLNRFQIQFRIIYRLHLLSIHTIINNHNTSFSL